MSEFQALLNEQRTFSPPPEFSATARIHSMEQYRQLCDVAERDPDRFWSARAKEALHWHTPFHTVMEWKAPHAKWFLGGKTNLSYNALDRHLATHGDKVAIRFEGEPGRTSAGSPGTRTSSMGR